MQSKYRPYFIALSLFFLGLCVYFFYFLKNSTVFEEQSKAKKYKNGDIEISKRYDRFDGKYYTKILFTLKNPKCDVSWDLHIDSEEAFQSLSLHSHVDYNNCDLNQKEVLEHSKPILYRVFKLFDKQKFSHVSFPEKTEVKIYEPIFLELGLKFKELPYNIDNYKRSFHNFILPENTGN